MSFCLNRNCRFKLLISIVSISITSMFLNPISARSFSNSHPKPPAPITKTLTFSCSISNISADGSNASWLKGPFRLSNFWTWFHREGQFSCEEQNYNIYSPCMTAVWWWGYWLSPVPMAQIFIGTLNAYLIILRPIYIIVWGRVHLIINVHCCKIWGKFLLLTIINVVELDEGKN